MATRTSTLSTSYTIVSIDANAPAGPTIVVSGNTITDGQVTAAGNLVYTTGGGGGGAGGGAYLVKNTPTYSVGPNQTTIVVDEDPASVDGQATHMYRAWDFHTTAAWGGSAVPVAGDVAIIQQGSMITSIADIAKGIVIEINGTMALRIVSTITVNACLIGKSTGAFAAGDGGTVPLDTLVALPGFTFHNVIGLQITGLYLMSAGLSWLVPICMDQSTLIIEGGNTCVAGDTTYCWGITIIQSGSSIDWNNGDAGMSGETSITIVESGATLIKEGDTYPSVSLAYSDSTVTGVTPEVSLSDIASRTVNYTGNFQPNKIMGVDVFN